MSNTHCVKCGEAFYPHHFHDNGVPFDTGYGIMPNDDRVCFACCAINDLKDLKEIGKADLYLIKKEGQWYICNWPGTLKIGPVYTKQGHHNWAGKRVDCWVHLDGAIYHGIQLGRWNEVVRIRRTKQATTWQSTIVLSK